MNLKVGACIILCENSMDVIKLITSYHYQIGHPGLSLQLVTPLLRCRRCRLQCSTREIINSFYRSEVPPVLILLQEHVNTIPSEGQTETCRWCIKER